MKPKLIVAGFSLIVSTALFAAPDGQPEPDDGLSPAELAALQALYKSKLSGKTYTVACRQTTGEPFFQKTVVSPTFTHFNGKIQLYDDAGCNHQLFDIQFKYEYSLGSEFKLPDDSYALSIGFALKYQPVVVGLSNTGGKIYMMGSSFSIFSSTPQSGVIFSN